MRVAVCHVCSRPLKWHSTLDLAKCMDPFCAEFDRPRIVQRAARVITETPELPRRAARSHLEAGTAKVSGGGVHVED